jgi:hypothetical protein
VSHTVNHFQNIVWQDLVGHSEGKRFLSSADDLLPERVVDGRAFGEVFDAELDESNITVAESLDPTTGNRPLAQSDVRYLRVYQK